MKPRPYPFLLIAFGTLSVTVLIYLGSRQADLDSEYSKLVTKEEEELSPANVGKRNWAQLVVRHRASAARNGDVVFYGKVVDEKQNPLSGVTLKGELQFYHPTLKGYLYGGDETPSNRLNLTTDSEGKLSVLDPVGISLDLFDFEKDDYVNVGKESHLFRFSSNRAQPHGGDPEAPEIFVMKEVE